VTINFLEPDFIDLFRMGLRGLAPDGTADSGFSGREMTRNAAVGVLDDPLNDVLELDGVNEAVVYTMVLGPPTSSRAHS
jgi:hypothetical protein